MTPEYLKQLLLPVTDLLTENMAYLTELDSVTGDGDHGVSMGKIAEMIRKTMNELRGEENVAEVLDDLSWNLMNVNGGSAGPLWGSFFEGMSQGAAKVAKDDLDQLKNMLIKAEESFYEVSKANVGQKTMMDAIAPATKVIRDSDENIEVLAEKMASAAAAGAEETVNMIAKFGRAKSLKEKSIGHKDPGAVSFSLFYKGIAIGLQKQKEEV
ncbi:dihydroxyacetone kinase ADP-binding subunit DhaL2 [Gottschalkiaceae bacterium SANA]|nr:dihydroxyacetone kinase ADP-binding subunit DhaL2 [Gottschalkiaceae bacterium SANA]